jgi:tetratricopeptide (TPR) repeat protein
MDNEPVSFNAFRYPSFLVGAVTVFAAECIIVEGLLLHRILPMYAVGAHAMLLLLLVLMLHAQKKQGKDLRPGLMLFAYTLGLGPLGPIAAFLTAFLTWIYSKHTKPFDEWYRALFPDEIGDDNRLIADLIPQESAQQDSIVPLIDILAFGSHAQKQALLVMVTNNFKPAFAAVLKTAINDADNSIRVQGATAIAKIENKFMARAFELSSSMENSPKDFSILKAMAKHYDDYGYMGLLDADREKECRDKAVACYRQYLELNPEDKEALFAIGRILVRGGKYEDALKWFDSIRAEDSSIESDPWYIECLFHCHRFETLRRLINKNWMRIQENANLPVEILDALRLWAAEGVEGTP